MDAFAKLAALGKDEAREAAPRAPSPAKFGEGEDPAIEASDVDEAIVVDVEAELAADGNQTAGEQAQKDGQEQDYGQVRAAIGNRPRAPKKTIGQSSGKSSNDPSPEKTKRNYEARPQSAIEWTEAPSQNVPLLFLTPQDIGGETAEGDGFECVPCWPVYKVSGDAVLETEQWCIVGRRERWVAALARLILGTTDHQDNLTFFFNTFKSKIQDAFSQARREFVPPMVRSKGRNGKAGIADIGCEVEDEAKMQWLQNKWGGFQKHRIIELEIDGCKVTAMNVVRPFAVKADAGAAKFITSCFLPMMRNVAEEITKDAGLPANVPPEPAPF